MTLSAKCVKCGTAVRAASELAGRRWICPKLSCMAENTLPPAENSSVESATGTMAPKPDSLAAPPIYDLRPVEQEENSPEPSVDNRGASQTRAWKRTLRIVALVLCVVGMSWFAFHSPAHPVTPKFNYTYYTWKAPEPPLRMIHKDEGFCFLSGVGGAFAGGAEYTYIDLHDDGYWYLSGHTNQGLLVVKAVSVVPVTE